MWPFSEASWGGMAILYVGSLFFFFFPVVTSFDGILVDSNRSGRVVEFVPLMPGAPMLASCRGSGRASVSVRWFRV